jgi:hypothetical protein
MNRLDGRILHMQPVHVPKAAERAEQARNTIGMRALNASLLAASLLITCVRGSCQGVFQLSATLAPIDPLPPFPVTFGGQGQFTLEGTSFRYEVGVAFYADWSCQIRDGGLTGAILFELPLSGCVPPIGPDRGACHFRGRLSLSEQAASDLLAQNWYVTAFLPYEGGDVHLGGQILQIPEPIEILWMPLLAVSWPILRRLIKRGSAMSHEKV